jgi:hypothetical protein
VKVGLRLAVALVSFAVAWVVAVFAGSFTSVPLAPGIYEPTPVMVVVVSVVLVVTLVVSLIVGNLTIRRYYKEPRGK